MKKLMLMVLLAAFTVACTKTEIQEIDEQATPKSKAVNSEGDGSEYELEDELDNSDE
ncbi:MAG: hypothetical protein AAF934_07760 [Bacteroidota bacterium]